MTVVIVYLARRLTGDLSHGNQRGKIWRMGKMYNLSLYSLLPSLTDMVVREARDWSNPRLNLTSESLEGVFHISYGSVQEVNASDCLDRRLH